jgi:hypothetical protein
MIFTGPWTEDKFEKAPDIIKGDTVRFNLNVASHVVDGQLLTLNLRRDLQALVDRVEGGTLFKQKMRFQGDSIKIDKVNFTMSASFIAEENPIPVFLIIGAIIAFFTATSLVSVAVISDKAEVLTAGVGIGIPLAAIAAILIAIGVFFPVLIPKPS